MNVYCPGGKSEDATDPSNKRQRGDDGEIVPEERCSWIGPLKDLKRHEDVCDFKIISCVVDGCNHECSRRDMNCHLSGEGFLHHMDLMKQSMKASYEKQIEKMEQKTQEMQKEMEERDRKRQDEILKLQAS